MHVAFVVFILVFLRICTAGGWICRACPATERRRRRDAFQTFFRCRRAVLTVLFVVYNLLFYVIVACQQIWDLGYTLGCGSTGISQKSQSLSVWDAPKQRHPCTFAVWKGMNTACTVHLKHARFTEDHNQHVLPAGGALGNYSGMICTSGTS